MKNTLFIFFAFLFSLSLNGQNFLEKHYENFLEDENTTHVFVSGTAFRMAGTVLPEEEIEIELGEDVDVKSLLKSVKSFSLIHVEEATDGRVEFKKGLRSIDDKYEELIRVRDADNQFGLFIDEDNDVVYEVIGLGHSGKEFFAFSLECEIAFEDISDIVSTLNDSQLEPIMKKRMPNADGIKVYPNPANANSTLNIELPKEFLGSEVNIFSVNGNKVQTFQMDSEKRTISTENMNAGNYFLEIQKDEMNIRKKFIIIQ